MGQHDHLNLASAQAVNQGTHRDREPTVWDMYQSPGTVLKCLYSARMAWGMGLRSEHARTRCFTALYSLTELRAATAVPAKQLHPSSFWHVTKQHPARKVWELFSSSTLEK